jgi:hypothetical protein
MNAITYWILRVLAFLCCTPMLLAMKAYWLAEGLREKKKIVPAPLRSAGPSAPEVTPEAPYPGPHKVDPVSPDRPQPLYFASPADKLGFAIASARARLRMEKAELEAQRQRAIDQEIAEMLGPVKEGDPR